jgi:hypothetical protein
MNAGVFLFLLLAVLAGLLLAFSYTPYGKKILQADPSED